MKWSSKPMIKGHPISSALKWKRKWMRKRNENRNVTDEEDKKTCREEIKKKCGKKINEWNCVWYKEDEVKVKMKLQSAKAYGQRSVGSIGETSVFDSKQKQKQKQEENKTNMKCYSTWS